MALAIRMSRGGRRNLPHYSIVVADSRSPRDGRFIEKVGTYNPLLKDGDENRVRLVKERIEYWLKQGAKPSDRVAIFLGKAGLVEVPKYGESPKKSAPKAKAQERVREKEEKAKAAAEAAAAAEAEAKAAAQAPVPAEEPVVEAPAEEPKAE